MKVDFRQIAPGGSEFNFSASADDLDLDLDGMQFPEPVEVELTVNKTGDEIIFQGRFSTMIEMECSRCLDNFEIPIKSKLQFVVQLVDDQEDQESGDEDFIVLSKTTPDYDISSRIREAIILEQPLKPLCSDDCRGLCSMCGTNLNEKSCNCTPDKSDDRWDALRQLFEE